MNWDAINAVGEMLGALAVLVSLLYLSVQIRQNTASVKSSTFQNAITSISHVSLAIATDKEAANVVYTAFAGNTAELSEQERFRAGLLLTGLFRNYENFWFQYQSGVMDEDMWQGICNAMLGYYRMPYVRQWWAERSSIFSPKFAEFLDRLAEPEKPSVP